jgi:hypothetical protein
MDKMKVIDAFCSDVVRRGIKCVVFDMDKTLVSLHSGGSLPKSRLNQYLESTSEVGRALIPALLAQGIRVSIATFSDDLYTSGIAGFPNASSSQRISGLSLTNEVLSAFLPIETVHSIPIVTLNPALYPSVTDDDPRRSFLREKIVTIGQKFLNAGSADYTQFVSLCATYPPLPNKSHHLQIISNLLGLDLRELCLIDDSDDNVIAAIKAGASGMNVPLRNGLAWEDLKIVSPDDVPKQKA